MLSKIILVLAFLFTPTILLAAKAPSEELEARAGTTIVRIASTQCTNKIVLDHLKPEYHAQFRKAEVRVEGKPVKGCWTMDANGVFIILENGEQGYVPPEVFKPVETL